MDTKDKLDLYREMLLMRRFEEKASDMYEASKVRGFLHLYIGQEAVASGFLWPIEPSDYVIAAYRIHGLAIARCADPGRVMAELYGKASGVCGGKGGSMHLFDADRRFLGGTAIVGGGLPIAAGIGYSIRYRNTDDVCLCFFGDGAINEGSFHETLNLAALWELPILFICENNLYGMGTAVERASAVPHLYQRAQCYAMDVRTVDGMDIMAVCQTAEDMIRTVRETKRPAFVEAVTYRYRGHSMSDPGHYRSKEEIEEWKQRDPVANLVKLLLKEGIVDQNKLDKLSENVDKQVQEAVDFAERSPKPEPDALFTNVYA